jgi:hypothetical protein
MYYDYLSPMLVGLFGPALDWEMGRGYERFMIAKDQEPIELVLGVGFLLFVANNRRMQRAGAYDRLPRPKLAAGRASFSAH